MPKHHERTTEGSSSSGRTTHTTPPPGHAGDTPGSRASCLDNEFWVSHRTWQFHFVSGECEPQPADNIGYLNSATVAIDQGFAPCPKCTK